MHEQERQSRLRLYLREMTATSLQSALMVLDVLGLVAVGFGEVAKWICPAFSEAALVQIVGNVLFIPSFIAGNYMAFARILGQKMELDAKLRKGGPRIVPADFSTEPGTRPELWLTVQNSADEDALNVSLYLEWDSYTFVCRGSCISSGGLRGWNLGECASRRRTGTPRAQQLSEKLADARELIGGPARSQVTEGGGWLFAEYRDVQQNVYQTVASYDGDTWETHYSGLAVDWTALP